MSQLQQWLGNFGLTGQILSAIPFAAFLGAAGWSSAFAGMAAASLLTAGLVFFAVQNERVPSATKPDKLTVSNIRSQMATNLANPATRFAFWIHFSSQSAVTVFALLWGIPFLERAQGLSQSDASLLISSTVLFGISAGVVYGWLCGAHPHLRYRIVLTASSAIIIGWAMVLLWPGQAPFWLLATLAAMLGASGTSSMIAFDVSKTYIAKSHLGSANGIINMGGFIATFVTMFLVGACLDIVQAVRKASGVVGAELYSLDGFRIAMWIQIAVVLLGLWGLRREHRLLGAAISNG